MKIVFTDLDGTLLDARTYSWEAALPALERLKLLGVPWIVVTSKTRAEVELWRRLLGNHHPFIVENGGAAYVPLGYFRFGVPGGTVRGDYEVLEWGAPYEDLVAGLEAAAQTSRCRVAGFHAMSVEEVAAACGLPLDEARLAKQREYDEAFRILDAKRTRRLLSVIEKRGLRWTRGGRFHHICGNNDKAVAVRAVSVLFKRVHGQITTIGLGDALNDAPFLEVVDLPVVVRSPSAAALLRRIPHGIMTARAGPAGWGDALLDLIPDKSTLLPPP